MSSKTLVYLGMIFGSALGGYLSTLFGASLISYSSVFFSGIGAIIGVWIGYKLGNYWSYETVRSYSTSEVDLRLHKY